MTRLVWLFLAGGLGVLTRFGLGGLIHRWYGGGFPLGTFVINIAGCFLFGWIWSLDQLKDEGLVTLEKVRVLIYRHSETKKKQNSTP